MRRYSATRNAIELIRERWGLGDPDSLPPDEGPGPAVHPLPTTAREPSAPYFRPLPGVPGRPLWDAPQPADSGAVDYAARQRSQLDEIPKGSSVEPVTVYPAWESRLENMRDFLAVTRLADAYSPLQPTPTEIELTAYSVPQGFTAFWKRFRFFFDPLPGALSPSNTLITLLVDGLIVPDYFNLPLGPFMASDQDTFIVASEGRRLSLRINITQNVGVIDMSLTQPFGLLYGNVRPRTGEPEARDVGVRPPTPPAPVVVMTPQAAPTPPSAAAAPAPAAPPSSPPFEIGVASVGGALTNSASRNRGSQQPLLQFFVKTARGPRPPTAAELVQWKPFFDRVKATHPANAVWIP